VSGDGNSQRLDDMTVNKLMPFLTAAIVVLTPIPAAQSASAEAPQQPPTASATPSANAARPANTALNTVAGLFTIQNQLAHGKCMWAVSGAFVQLKPCNTSNIGDLWRISAGVVDSNGVLSLLLQLESVSNAGRCLGITTGALHVRAPLNGCNFSQHNLDWETPGLFNNGPATSFSTDTLTLIRNGHYAQCLGYNTSNFDVITGLCNYQGTAAGEQWAFHVV
jgi:hypothetical protein